MKPRACTVFILLFMLSLLAQATSGKHRLVLNVYKPIYINDTAIFPNARNCATLKKTYKCTDLIVADATIIITEFGSDKSTTVTFNKSENAYCYDLSQESFTITIQKKGFVDQKRIYLGNGHNDYVEYNGTIKLNAFLFTTAETPIITGKEILPYKASGNKIVLQVFDVKNDSMINNTIEQLVKKYQLKNISNEYCELPFLNIRSDLNKPNKEAFEKKLTHDQILRPYYYIILQKSEGEFSENDCPELAEIRNYEWGKSSGPLLGYSSLTQTKGDFTVTYLSSYIKASLGAEDIKVLHLTPSKTARNIYCSPFNLGLGWAKQLYQFHLLHPLTEISNLSANLSFL
jgi:hypothetical protein